MFVKSAIVALGFFGITAVAAPGGPPGGIVGSQCRIGTAQCCNTVGKASSPSVIKALGLLAGLLDGITDVVGLGCNPFSAIRGRGGINCALQPVCCIATTFNGLVNIGCTPISR